MAYVPDRFAVVPSRPPLEWELAGRFKVELNATGPTLLQPTWAEVDSAAGASEGADGSEGVEVSCTGLETVFREHQAPVSPFFLGGHTFFGTAFFSSFFLCFGGGETHTVQRLPPWTLL